MEGVKFARDDLIDRLDECETTLRGARNRIGELDDELASTQASAESIFRYILFFNWLLLPSFVLSTLYYGMNFFHSIYFYYFMPREAYSALWFTTSYSTHIHF